MKGGGKKTERKGRSVAMAWPGANEQGRNVTAGGSDRMSSYADRRRK